MHRTALQSLARASLRPSVVAPCTCAQPTASTSLASSLVQQRRQLATAASGRRAIPASSSIRWKRWQSTSSAASSSPAGFKTSYPTSSAGSLSSTISASRPRQRTVNTSLPQIKVSRSSSRPSGISLRWTCCESVIQGSTPYVCWSSSVRSYSMDLLCHVGNERREGVFLRYAYATYTLPPYCTD